MKGTYDTPQSMRKKTIQVQAGGDAKQIWELIKKKRAEKANVV